MAWYGSTRGGRARRLENYFEPLHPNTEHFRDNPNAHPSNKLTLLDLPRHVFRRIMQHVSEHLTGDCAVFLNNTLSGRYDDELDVRDASSGEWEGLRRDEDVPEENLRFAQWYEMCPNQGSDAYGCSCEGGPREVYRLMQCSRAFWMELAPLLYAKNSFVVHRCAHGGLLKPLKRIGPANLASLTSLRLIVNSAYTSVAHGVDAVKITQESEMKHHPDLRYSKLKICRCYPNDPVFKDDFLYQYCSCDGVDRPFIQTRTGRGRVAIKELEAVIGLLRAVIKPDQLELGIICDCKDFATAQAFASVMQNLPRLRNCALRLSLEDDERIHSLASETVAKLTGKPWPVDLSRFAQLPRELRNNVLECSDLVAPTDIDVNAEPPHGRFSLQFSGQTKLHICQPVHGWATRSVSFAKSCTCWEFPRSMFLVNKEFHHESKRIFCGGNHFIILPDEGRSGNGDAYGYEHRFWRFRWAALMLPWLRSVQVSLPLDTAFLARDKVVADIEAFRWVRDGDDERRAIDQAVYVTPTEYWAYCFIKGLGAVSLHRLELTVDFRTVGSRDMPGYQLPRKHLPALRAMFLRVASILAVLIGRGTDGKGLAKFFVLVPDEVGEEYARGLESMVMGQRYDGCGQGKYVFPNRFQHWVQYLVMHRGWVPPPF